MRRRTYRLVHPEANRVFKFFPDNPPRRGDTVLIDGAHRCRVVRCKVDWEGRQWTIRGPIKVLHLRGGRGG